MRDRDIIVDKKDHRQVWKTVGEPGAVLVGSSLSKQLREEADRVAELRGASTTQANFENTAP